MKTKSDQWQVTSDKPTATDGRCSRHSSLVTRHPFAFTLIELLVVISIMGILAALLFPVTGMVKRREYINTATAEMNQIETALDNYKAKYGVYPPANQNSASLYAPPADRSMLSQLYYELSGVLVTNNNNGSLFVTLDSASQIPAAGVSAAYNVGGFINCSKGAGEDATSARDFLPGLKASQINAYVTNNGVQTTMLVTTVGGPDAAYRPLHATGINPFRYIYPGTNNPTSYDLWIQLVIRGQTNLVCNWTKQVPINSPLP